MNNQDTKCFEIFKSCVDAIHDGELIRQVSRRDKEFHFQNWCQKQLEAVGVHFEGTGRNVYPDFCLVEYVVPTPFALTQGTAGLATLILPEDYMPPKDFICVGDLSRMEGGKLVSGYRFDLRTNEIRTEMTDNPNAGKEHRFKAYRCVGQSERRVTMVNPTTEMEICVDDD